MGSYLVQGQTFPDLQNFYITSCIGSAEEAPFSTASGLCPPWKNSHGTPNSNNYGAPANNAFDYWVEVASGKDGAQGAQKSEGALYPYNFKKDHIYKLKFSYQTRQGGLQDPGLVDQAFIALTNDVQPDLTGLGGSISYTQPSHNDAQKIFEVLDEETFTLQSPPYNPFYFRGMDANGWQEIELYFVPKQNYSKMWITVYDDDAIANNDSEKGIKWSVFAVGGLHFECVGSIPNTNITYTNSAIPTLSEASNQINAKNNTTIYSNNQVSFKSANSILLEPNFSAQAGSDFLAYIGENCTYEPNMCAYYELGGVTTTALANINNYSKAIAMPNAAGHDPWGNISPLIVFSKGYNLPYNAWKGKLSIYNRWGGLIHVDEEVSSDYKSGIPPNSLTWNPCIAGHQDGVYAAVVTLYHCDGTTTSYTQDVTVTCACNCLPVNNFTSLGYLQTLEHNNTSLDAPLNTIEAKKTSDLALSVYPNPIKNETTIAFTLDKETAVSISIIDALGRTVKNVILNELKSEGHHQLSLKELNLGKGVYYLHLMTSEHFITKSILVSSDL